MTDVHEYVLGTDAGELERLRFQHQAWVKEAYALWQRAGFGTGQTLVDLGCGPGYTSFELAHVAGPGGTVVARDESPAFLDFLRAEAARLGLRNIWPSLGPVEAMTLSPGSIDGAYARWLLCWLDDPFVPVEHVAAALRPGGALVLQEYLDWATFRFLPRSDIVDKIIAACMQSWWDAELPKSTWASASPSWRPGPGWCSSTSSPAPSWPRPGP